MVSEYTNDPRVVPWRLPEAVRQRWAHREAGELVILDNRDSFVFNLAHRFAELGERGIVVVRSDAVDVQTLRSWAPRGIVLSPGPGHPRDAGCCVEVIRQLSGHLPLFGVCLGHQAIGEAFGAVVDANGAPRHGMDSLVTHDGTGAFAGLEHPMRCGRYHALVVREPLPDPLHATAHADGWLMGLAHRHHPTWGVQFHPESVLTPDGLRMLANVARLMARPTDR